MTKLLIMLCFSFCLNSYANSIDCKEIIAKSIVVNQLSLKNLDLVRGNLLIEANLVEKWARQIERANQRNARISPLGFKENSSELKQQAKTLDDYIQSINTELQRLLIEAEDCR